MNKTQHVPHFGLVLTIFVELSFVRVGLAAPPVPITRATISADIPTEVVDGTTPPASVPVAVTSLPLDFFDDFSWRSFIAVNWPAQGIARGVPDRTKSIGDGGTRVWETWKSGFEIVPENATANPPLPWDEWGPTPCGIVAAGARVFGSFDGFGDMNEAGFDVIGSPLVCQNRTYTRYETRVNQTEYKFIVAKKLYLRSSLLNLQQPDAPILAFDFGSIEIKAAWREFVAIDTEAIRKNFYRVTASVRHPITGICEMKEMGLVGMHIVQKTPLRPQWIWSSFEHVNNVSGTSSSYNNPAKPQVTDSAPPTLTKSTFSPTPNETQVVRELPLAPDAPVPGVIGTAATNTRYQMALAGTVWANYQLVLTQWPTNTAAPDGTPTFPDATGSTTSVGNTTMETYEQQFTSCMDCHDSARKKNTDFVFFLHFRAFDDVRIPGSARPLVLDDLFATKLRSQTNRLKK